MLTFRLCGLAALVCALGSFPARGAGPATAAAQASASPAASVLPPISAQALDKTPIAMPAQLEGRRNLLLLSWARDQGPQIDTWTAVAQALEHTYPDDRVYRMPVSPPENALSRWWDSSSLRNAETDPELLHWTVPLYTDRAALRHALGLSENTRLVAAVLVDRTGRVLWKAQGPSTTASREGLLAAAAR